MQVVFRIQIVQQGWQAVQNVKKNNGKKGKTLLSENITFVRLNGGYRFLWAKAYEVKVIKKVIIPNFPEILFFYMTIA